MSNEEQELRLRLAKMLATNGHLRTRPWREAVEAVPRHEFLRGGFFDRIDGSGPTAWTPITPHTPLWLERCYEDESLVTQIAGTIVPGDLRGEIMRAPTSSSTMPSLVVRMWEDLQVEDDDLVLEVGTGTGYSTALGCHRLTDERITSVEVDAGVSARAGTALAQCGYHPQLIVGDGLAGHAAGSPYDRVIVTCGLVSLPYAWVEQTRPGGTILATLGGWMFSSELARLTVNDDGTASGRFLGGQISFMLARPQSPPPLGMLPDIDQGDERLTTLGADVINDWDTRFVAQIAAPRAQRISLDRDGRTEHVLVDVGDGSWAALAETEGRWTVRQGGPERIWDDIETHVRLWREAGTPTLEKFQVTVTPDGQKITW
ncbi:ATP-grasp peptide maturase system methyltransferase [Streptomyces sp. NBC_01216]|uniref:ATP-grasp peptide maturase system methyltransferase n=1 Tax=Streptomyces sp. NBC_01216 TaxID=2903778 RepID=UPI002E1277D0|nr:ATP-grasp peptide maturase system methyltransferase [Streptomyces sp. NBC_01216]